METPPNYVTVAGFRRSSSAKTSIYGWTHELIVARWTRRYTDIFGVDRAAEIVDVHACNHGGGTAVKSKRQSCRSRLTIGTRRTNLSAFGLDRSLPPPPPPPPLSSVSRRSALVLLVSYASVTADLLHRSRSLPVVRAFVRIFQSVAECLEIVNFSFESSVPPCIRYFFLLLGVIVSRSLIDPSLLPIVIRIDYLIAARRETRRGEGVDRLTGLSRILRDHREQPI